MFWSKCGRVEKRDKNGFVWDELLNGFMIQNIGLICVKYKYVNA